MIMKELKWDRCLSSVFLTILQIFWLKLRWSKTKIKLIRDLTFFSLQSTTHFDAKITNIDD